MINPKLRCPSCGQLGFLVSEKEDDLAELYGAMCHYCGHVMERDEILEALARAAAEPPKRGRLG
jgi:uncharacterized Zn finger protein